MAQPALEKFTRRAFAMVEQVAEGVPQAVVNGTHGLTLYDGSSGTESDKDSTRPDRPYFTNEEIAHFNHRAFIEGTKRIVAPTTPGDAVNGTPECDILLRTGGMTKVLDNVGGTTRYNPITFGIPIATAHWWHAITFREVFDARTAISAFMAEIGKRDSMKVRVQGSYEDIDEQALPTDLVAPNDENPIVQYDNSQSTFGVIGGLIVPTWAKSLSIDFNSDLKSKEYTEHKENSIDARNATWTMRIARPEKADIDPWAIRRAGSKVAGTFRSINDAGIYTERGFRGQIDSINEVDIDGDYGLELSGPCQASSAGGDEFYLEFGNQP